MKATYTDIKVRGYHLDMYGHMNNARYLEVLEEARWDHFENRVDLAEFKKQHWAFVIVNVNINYRNPALLSDVIQVRTEPKNVGQRSVVMKQVLTRKGSETIIADAEITFVVMDLRSEKALSLDGRLREIILGDV